MAIAGVSNLGLDAVGRLLFVRRGRVKICGKRGSSAAVGGVVERCCVGRGTDERLRGAEGIVQRWKTRRTFTATTLVAAAAADDVEQREEEEEPQEQEEQEEETVRSQWPEEVSSKEVPKISGVEQKKQRTGARKKAGPRTLWKFSSLAEEWISFTGPREKGDLRDVVLMSLSFAVLVYISQHLVHAYCALRHMCHNHY